MSKYSNIYDIDGNLIRKADEGPFSIEETEELIKNLTKKVEENPDNEVYKVYLTNAQKWLTKLYTENSIELLKKRITEAKEAQNEAEKAELDQITEAMEQLKAEYDAEPTTQEDMLVERAGEAPEMEEYTEFEEVKNLNKTDERD